MSVLKPLVFRAAIVAIAVATLAAAPGTSTITYAAEPAPAPTRIAVLVDTSQAMESYISDVRRALPGFFRELQGDHQIALFEFGDRATRGRAGRSPVGLGRPVEGRGRTPLRR